MLIETIGSLLVKGQIKFAVIWTLESRIVVISGSDFSYELCANNLDNSRNWIWVSNQSICSLTGWVRMFSRQCELDFCFHNAVILNSYFDVRFPKFSTCTHDVLKVHSDSLETHGFGCWLQKVDVPSIELTRDLMVCRFVSWQPTLKSASSTGLA